MMKATVVNSDRNLLHVREVETPLSLNLFSTGI